MQSTSNTLRKYINSAYLKRKINRTNIDTFKQNITALFNLTDKQESEEYLKNLISDFLKNTYYSPNYYINTRGRSDLVIYNGKDPQSSVGIIIEAKALKNKTEMPSEKNLNTKAFQELLLYYLRERITQNNIDLKHLIITNLEEWYIFDAQLFEKLFAHDRILIQQFKDFEEKRLAVNDHSLFYKEVAKPAIELNLKRISYCYFNILDYKDAIQNRQKKNDNQLIPLYKILSPEHLLKLPFNNDSNQLDKEFYSELLHIIGLKEEKDSGKSVIRRKVEKERNSGSLLECAIAKIDGMDILYNLQNRSNYGETKEEQLFNVGLELAITWINRILFLKLLEGQLIAYHKGDNGYTFLNFDKIRSFDDLNDLFFLVMAKQPSERTEKVHNSFLNVPYLNSSLFELTELESRSINISALPDDIQLSLPNGTVLKDNNGKTKSGNIDTLEYLFAFLNAYDFTSDGAEDIQEENKNLINASVLGLIFEKINGYKDGSFFTPGFITMYIAEETIHKAILLKFKEAQGLDCKSLEELRENIKDRKAANELINSIKICDPAVGSGHFLVSALNEMIASKARLGILLDNNGFRINDYEIEVQNDELVVKDETGKLFEYRPALKERQIVQETLFREKRTIIENCLFGVDVNPNSVKICQLRLWIELLKNAYYKENGKSADLETLPNIDINIKCGNSLISRFPLDASLKHLLKGTKWTIETYQTAVSNYRNAHSKDEKHDLLQLIKGIKEDFKKDIFVNDPIIKKIHSLRSNLLPLQQTSELFGEEKSKTKEGKKKIAQLEKEIKKLEEKVDEIKSNKIYEQAFEWRFEFPEILDEDGRFIGFDCIIGNPPYIQLQKMGAESEKLAQMGFETYTRMGDIYMLFFELGNHLLQPEGVLTFITSNKWMRTSYGELLRAYLVSNVNTEILIDFAGQKIFDAATVDTCILLFSKQKYTGNTLACQVKEKVLNNLSVFIRQQAGNSNFKTSSSWVILSPVEQSIKSKIEAVGTPLKDWDINIYRGILTGYNEAFIIDGKKKDELIAEDAKSAEIIRPILRGRDIKRYGYDYADLWLINTHNGMKEKGIKPIDIRDYPAIQKHLDTYFPELEKRADKGDSPYNLRNCAYMDDFSKQKIVWLCISDRAVFALDTKGLVCNNAVYFIASRKAIFLCGFLNHKLIEWYFDKICSSTGVGTNKWEKFVVESIPIPILSDYSYHRIEKFVKLIIQNKEQSINYDAIEKELKYHIYEAYGINDEEIAIIENSR